VNTTTRILATLGLVLVATLGCDKLGGGKTTASHGNVAIIDLDAIARATGYGTQMTAAIQQQKTSLEKQLGVIQASFNEDLTKKKNELGASPTQEQTQQLAQQQRAAVVKLNQEQRNASRLLSQYSTQLIQQFRNAVKPVARTVAAEQGLSVILTKYDALVFDYDTAVDITDAVIERMRTEQPIAAAGPQENREPAPPPAAANNRAPDYGRP